MRARSLATSLLGLAVLAAAWAPGASAAVIPQPAWKLLTATAPSHLPPLQSETQRVTVEAEGGTFTLSYGAQASAPIAFDAEASAVQAALEALSTLGAGSVTVSGGPGGDTESPYFVSFTGAAVEDKDAEELKASAAALTGAHPAVHVVTTVPGGEGTGYVGVAATNVGGLASSGKLTIEVGPLPTGIVLAGKGESKSGWSCNGTAGQSEAQCTLEEPVLPLRAPFTVRFPVKVGAGAAPSSSAPVRIEELGGAEAQAEVPITVSATPAEAGVGAFWAGSFEADGTPSIQAGAHPYSTFTSFTLNTVRAVNGKIVPAGDAREFDVDLPPGFLGNPLATPRCTQSELTCGGESVLGGFTAEFGSFSGSRNTFPVENAIPVFGYAAEFSTKAVAPLQTLLGQLRSEEDFGVRIVAPNSATTFNKLYSTLTALEGFPAGAHGAPFLRNPTDCAQQRQDQEAGHGPATKVSSSTWQEPDRFTQTEDPLPLIEGCEKLQIEPEFSFQPTTNHGSSPAGATAHLHLDQSGLSEAGALAPADLKRSVVKLPAGLGVNPAQANGLAACSEAQVGYIGAGPAPNPTRFNDAPVSCPDASKIGTLEATSPLLEDPLEGTVYLAAQEANPFGSLIGLYLVIESARFGVTLKLPGKADIDPNTGQITATFDYVPQAPVEDLTLHLRGGGPRSSFATPEVCGTYTTHGDWEPWSAPESGPDAQTDDSFDVNTECSSSASARPFHPSFEAGTTDPLAGAYSPLVVKVARKDGEQEIERLDFSLPQGLVGKLAGVPYCPEGAIAQAKARSGAEELASPSCPQASRLGSIDSAAGVGPEPIHVGGSVYLAGPYEGAPVSAVAIVPAVAGPFDLGDVVVRTPIRLDPETAQVSAVSDPLPTSLRGIPVKLRSVAISLDRSAFTLNPTSCEESAVGATLKSSDGATATPSNRFQVGGCSALGFKPKLSISLKGSTRRGGHPALKVVLAPRAGDANIEKLSVAMPHSEFLSNAHIRTICTRVQFAQGAGGGTACPKGSIYGQVSATSPLLDYTLTGPLLLRASSHKLPDLVAVLRGPAEQPVAIWQAGRIDSIRGGIRTRFESIPDAPVSRIVVQMPGGGKGLLENHVNICAHTHRAQIGADAHNGRRSDFAQPLKAVNCAKGKAKGKGKGHKRHRSNGR